MAASSARCKHHTRIITLGHECPAQVGPAHRQSMSNQVVRLDFFDPAQPTKLASRHDVLQTYLICPLKDGLRQTHAKPQRLSRGIQAVRKP